MLQPELFPEAGWVGMAFLDGGPDLLEQRLELLGSRTHISPVLLDFGSLSSVDGRPVEHALVARNELLQVLD